MAEEKKYALDRKDLFSFSDDLLGIDLFSGWGAGGRSANNRTTFAQRAPKVRDQKVDMNYVVGKLVNKEKNRKIKKKRDDFWKTLSMTGDTDDDWLLFEDVITLSGALTEDDIFGNIARAVAAKSKPGREMKMGEVSAAVKPKTRTDAGSDDDDEGDDLIETRDENPFGDLERESGDDAGSGFAPKPDAKWTDGELANYFAVDTEEGWMAKDIPLDLHRDLVDKGGDKLEQWRGYGGIYFEQDMKNEIALFRNFVVRGSDGKLHALDPTKKQLEKIKRNPVVLEYWKKYGGDEFLKNREEKKKKKEEERKEIEGEIQEYNERLKELENVKDAPGFPKSDKTEKMAVYDRRYFDRYFKFDEVKSAYVAKENLPGNYLHDLYVFYPESFYPDFIKGGGAPQLKTYFKKELAKLVPAEKKKSGESSSSSSPTVKAMPGPSTLDKIGTVAESRKPSAIASEDKSVLESLVSDKPDTPPPVPDSRTPEASPEKPPPIPKTPATESKERETKEPEPESMLDPILKDNVVGWSDVKRAATDSDLLAPLEDFGEEEKPFDTAYSIFVILDNQGHMTNKYMHWKDIKHKTEEKNTNNASVYYGATFEVAGHRLVHVKTGDRKSELKKTKYEHMSLQDLLADPVPGASSPK